MNRSIFHLILIFFFNFNVVLCSPQLNYLNQNELNSVVYFYCGNVQKILIQSDLDLFLNNFDQTSFELVKFLKNDNSHFMNKDPREHYNLILNLNDFYLNYYYSFPFSHNTPNLYFKYLYEKDLNYNDVDQY